MKALAILFLLLALPSAHLVAPDSVEYGETLIVTIVLDNPMNVSVTFYIDLISPYTLHDSRIVEPQSSENYTIYITTTEYRVGESVNVTAIVSYSIFGQDHQIVLKKRVAITEGSRRNLTSILIGLTLLSLGISVIGYLAMARRKKEEEEEPIRPPRL